MKVLIPLVAATLLAAPAFANDQPLSCADRGGIGTPGKPWTCFLGSGDPLYTEAKVDPRDVDCTFMIEHPICLAAEGGAESDIDGDDGDAR